jgi:hypothetical protein
VTAAALEPRSRLVKWQAINLGLLVAGYAGYYLCRSNLSVAMPLIIQDLGRHGIGADAARISLGSQEPHVMVPRNICCFRGKRNGHS